MFSQPSQTTAPCRLSPLGIERHSGEGESEEVCLARLAELETRMRTKEKEIWHLNRKISDVQSHIASLQAQVNKNKNTLEATQSLSIEQRQLLSKRSRAFLQIVQSEKEEQNARIDCLSRDQFAQIEAEGERIFHQICNRFERARSNDQISKEPSTSRKERQGALPRKRQLCFESAEFETPRQLDQARARIE